MIHGKPCVIESGAEPSRRHPSCVAGRTGRRETRGTVIRISCPQKIGLVAGIAIGGRTRELPVDVALRARNTYVRPLQRERGVVVVKGGIEPALGGMAYGAIGGISEAHVIGDSASNRGGIVVVLRVTAVAIGG